MNEIKTHPDSNNKLTPDSLGLEIVDRLCIELSAEAFDFKEDNKRISANSESQQAFAKYREFPVESVQWLIKEMKLGITDNGEWSLPFEGFFDTSEGYKHRIFGRQIKSTKPYYSWRCTPSGSPLPIVPFYLGNYLTAKTIIIVEGAWDAMALAIAAGWDKPDAFPLDVSILGNRGSASFNGLFGFIGKLWRGQRNFLIIADNDKSGKQWLREPDLCRGLVDKASGIWLTHIKEEHGKDVNDALKKGAFTDWSLDSFVKDLRSGFYRPKDLDYGPLQFAKHQNRLAASPIPKGERLYGINGAKDDFPLDAFPQVIQDLVHERVRIHKLEIPQSCLTILACASGCIGPWFSAIDFASGRKTHGNLFALITAPPGSGKTTLLQFLNPLILHEVRLQNDFRKDIFPKLKARETRLEKELKDFQRTTRKEPLGTQSNQKARSLEDVWKEIREIKEQLNNPPTLTVGKTTIPALVKTFQCFDKYIFQILDESSTHICQVLGLSRKQDESPDLDLYLSLYSNSPYANDTVTRGRITAEGWLGFLWCMQPVVKEKLQSSKDFSGRGFFARSLFVDTKSTEIPMSEELSKPSDDLWDIYNRGMSALLERRTLRSSVELECTKQGRERLNDIHNEESQFRNSVLRTYKDCFGRHREHAIKLYILLYALDLAFVDPSSSAAFSLERLEKAIRLAKWFHEELAGMLLKDGIYKNRKTKDELITTLNSYKYHMLSQGELNECGINFDRFQTIWSLFPESFVVWKSQAAAGRHTVFIGTKD